MEDQTLQISSYKQTICYDALQSAANSSHQTDRNALLVGALWLRVCYVTSCYALRGYVITDVCYSSYFICLFKRTLVYAVALYFFFPIYTLLLLKSILGFGIGTHIVDESIRLIQGLCNCMNCAFHKWPLLLHLY